jgi:carbon storage regulator
MLVLNRGVDQSLTVGDNAELEIKVLSIRRNRVCLGVTAPREIPVARIEIYEAKKLNFRNIKLVKVQQK